MELLLENSEEYIIHRLHGNELSECGVITNLYLQQVSYGQFLHSVMNNAASMLERGSFRVRHTPTIQSSLQYPSLKTPLVPNLDAGTAISLYFCKR